MPVQREPALTSPDDCRLSPAAVAALYVEHADELRAFLIGVLRNGDLASEALQATFVKATELGHTAQKESLKGWLFRVAFHEAMLIRRRRRLDEKAVRQLAWSRHRADVTPEDHVTRWELVERVKTALEGLPEEQRQVVHLRIYEEKKFAEIAELVGAPLGTVLTRMRLALQKLDAELQADFHSEKDR